MSVIASVGILAGSVVALIAGVGLIKFETSYARFHAAGKASPIAVLLISAGASFEIGWSGAALLLVACSSLILALPVAVHLLFRAVHRTTSGTHLSRDDLAPDEASAWFETHPPRESD